MRPRLAFLLILCLLLLGFLIYTGGKELQTPPPDSIGGPFTLTEGDGKTVTEKDFAGKYMLVYFGYTYCPDVCPTTLAKMMAALKDMGGRAKNIQPLFITVDPERDTPAVVGGYANAFGGGLIGLTGTSEEIATVEKEYKVFSEKHPAEPGATGYVMDHSSVLYLMGPDGRFIAAVNPDQSADALADEIGRNLK